MNAHQTANDYNIALHNLTGSLEDAAHALQSLAQQPPPICPTCDREACNLVKDLTNQLHALALESEGNQVAIAAVARQVSALWKGLDGKISNVATMAHHHPNTGQTT